MWLTPSVFSDRAWRHEISLYAASLIFVIACTETLPPQAGGLHYFAFPLYSSQHSEKLFYTYPEPMMTSVQDE